MKQLVTVLLLLSISLSIAQTDNQSQLTIDQIMQGDDFVGYLPTSIEWSENSKDIYFSWNPDMDTIRSTYRVNINTQNIEKLSFDDLKSKSNGGRYSKDGKWKVYEKSGDLFLLNTTYFTTKRITNTNNRESNPQFSGDGKSIIYQDGNNLFQWQITDGTLKQLTDFKSGNERSNVNLNAQDQWLEDDQMEHFDILQKRKNASDASEYRREQTQFERPETIYIGNKGLYGVQISPDLKYVVYRLYSSPSNKSTMVPDFVTESGYTNERNARPKVGKDLYTYESWILNLETNTHYQIKTEDIDGIKDKAKLFKGIC